jgi:antitoxin component YwqK of YwqJK toxin-antitoxin module
LYINDKLNGKFKRYDINGEKLEYCIYKNGIKIHLYMSTK